MRNNNRKSDSQERPRASQPAIQAGKGTIYDDPY